MTPKFQEGDIVVRVIPSVYGHIKFGEVGAKYLVVACDQFILKAKSLDKNLPDIKGAMVGAFVLASAEPINIEELV